MGNQRSGRLSYEESCKFLQRLGYLVGGSIPPMPDHRPQYDDEEPLGVSFFRTAVTGDAVEDLTLPRTFFGRSDVGLVSFKNTDLADSTLCWNDFHDVDFSDCDLSRSDLRASSFKTARFTRADLRDADMRRSSFEDCDFGGAKMRGVKLTNPQASALLLSDEQRKEIDWQSSDGEEPRGG
jgi:BTB/POZ domain-containing protein KCTD9